MKVFNKNRIYVELNTHLVTENDWKIFQEILEQELQKCNIIDFQIKPISSTSAIIEFSGNENIITCLRNVRIIERIGFIVDEIEFRQEKLVEIINYIIEISRRYNAHVIPKTKIFILRSLLRKYKQKSEDMDNVLLITDYEVENVLKLLIVIGKTNDFKDLVDLFSDTYFSDVYYIVSGVESLHEILAICRITCALKVHTILTNVNFKKFNSRRIQEIKKFLSLGKIRVMKDINKAVNYLKKRLGSNIIFICLSMHSKFGEVELTKILDKHIDKIPVYIIGSERWGLNINEVWKCQYFVRLGPSTGIPLSSSEVIAYTAVLTRFVKSMGKNYKDSETNTSGSR